MAGEPQRLIQTDVRLIQTDVRQDRLEPAPANLLGFRLAKEADLFGRIERAEIEARILNGDDEVVMHQGHGKTARYVLPDWRRHPIARLKVAYARCQHRKRKGANV